MQVFLQPGLCGFEGTPLNLCARSSANVSHFFATPAARQASDGTGMKSLKLALKHIYEAQTHVAKFKLKHMQLFKHRLLR